MYDSAKLRFPSSKQSPAMVGESRSIDSRKQANMSNNSHSVANVYGGDDNYDKKSPEL